MPDAAARTKTLRGPGGITLLLDRSEVFFNDPGAGTPAMVSVPKLFGRACATYTCAAQTGLLLDSRGNDVALSDAQVRWLNSEEIENAVILFLSGEDLAASANPEDGEAAQ